MATTRTGEDRDNDLTRRRAPTPGPDNPAELKGKGVFAALKRTFKQFSEDNVSDWAAALTYYGVLSIFPGVLVLVSILGMLSDDGQQTVQDTVNEIAPNQQIQNLVNTVLDQVQDPGTAGLAAIIGIVAGVLVGVRLHRRLHARLERRSTTCPRAGRSGRPCRSGSASPRSSASC